MLQVNLKRGKIACRNTEGWKKEKKKNQKTH